MYFPHKNTSEPFLFKSFRWHFYIIYKRIPLSLEPGIRQVHLTNGLRICIDTLQLEDKQTKAVIKQPSEKSEKTLRNKSS